MSKKRRTHNQSGSVISQIVTGQRKLTTEAPPSTNPPRHFEQSVLRDQTDARTSYAQAVPQRR